LLIIGYLTYCHLFFNTTTEQRYQCMETWSSWN